MGLILILAAIVLIAIVVLIINTRNWEIEGIECCFGITLLFTALSLVIALAVLADKKADTKYDIAKYENLKEQLVSMENGECDVPSDVLECVLDVNNMIEDHKAHVDSWFTGVYHSKEVAALEHLKLPMTKDEPKEE